MVDLAELRAKQSDVMGRVHARVAGGKGGGQAHLEQEGAQLAKRLGGILVPPPGPKALADSRAKVARDYGGEWNDLKDMIRITIIVPSQEAWEDAMQLFERSQGSVIGGLYVFATKRKDPRLFYGYIDGTGFVQLPNGSKGEIQVNTPAMLYAKDLQRFMDSYGRQGYAAMKATYTLEGGLGHDLYAFFRNLPEGSPLRKKYEAASLAYYAVFRMDRPTMTAIARARVVLGGLCIPWAGGRARR